MKHTTVSTPKSQKGMTVISMVLLLCFIGVLALTMFKVVPIYIDYFNLRKVIEGVKTDVSAASSPADVRRMLERRWAIDYINVVSYKDLKVYKKNGALMLDLAYEDRRPLFYNMEVIATFDEPIQLAP